MVWINVEKKNRIAIEEKILETF